MRVVYIGLKHAKPPVCPLSSEYLTSVERPYHPFCMFEPNIFSVHTCYVTDNHFPKDKTVFQLS
ncbi:hypothetical protein LDENG_00270830 [Lucifuga dentata]|nr:hypothetical protein LDENG_00270830 [Lucifuga dentata]